MEKLYHLVTQNLLIVSTVTYASSEVRDKSVQDVQFLPKVGLLRMAYIILIDLVQLSCQTNVVLSHL